MLLLLLLLLLPPLLLLPLLLHADASAMRSLCWLLQATQLAAARLNLVAQYFANAAAVCPAAFAEAQKDCQVCAAVPAAAAAVPCH
jgi:hypothetical protein